MKQDNEPMRKDFRPIVQAIGSDLMQTQVRIASGRQRRYALSLLESGHLHSLPPRT